MSALRRSALASLLAVVAGCVGAAPDPGDDDDGGAVDAAPGDPVDGGGEADAAVDDFAPDSLLEALIIFGDCMRYEDFAASDMQDVANQPTSSGACSNCHGGGLAGVPLSTDDLQFYRWQRDQPYIFKFAAGTVNDDGAFADLKPARRYELKGQDGGHPSYTLSDGRLTAIQTFYDDSYARYAAAIAAETPCVRDDP